MKNNHYGTCPLCKESFNAKEAEYAFPLTIKDKKIYLIFAFCQKCISNTITLDKKGRTKIAKIAIRNFFEDITPNWTITSNLAMAVHKDNFYEAWSIGVDIPYEMFDLINDGHIDTLFFIPGVARWR